MRYDALRLFCPGAQFPTLLPRTVRSQVSPRRTSERGKRPRQIAKVEIRSRTALRDWLSSHHAQQDSIWLITYKKAYADKHVPHDAIVEEALCFGWVDSLPRKFDETRSMLLLSPRRPGSSWARINKDRAEKLITAGLMTDTGFAKIKLAMKDGSWSRLDFETPTIPADLAASFKRHAGSKANFLDFPPSVRRAILEWIDAAKRKETRAKRIEETATLAAQNIRANQWRKT